MNGRDGPPVNAGSNGPGDTIKNTGHASVTSFDAPAGTPIGKIKLPGSWDNTTFTVLTPSGTPAKNFTPKRISTGTGGVNSPNKVGYEVPDNKKVDASGVIV